jgi:adenosylmethionine-8-amino-7-oxononanoate aminotransferase
VLRRWLDAVAARIDRVRRITAIGLLSSIELDVEGVADVDDVLLRVRHAMYEQGVLVRCSQAGGILTVVFYPALVVSDDDVERGVLAVGNALEAVLG